MPSQSNAINLVSLFKTVAGSLASQQQQLNQADTYNHDHGDHMVEVFNVIAQAMQAKKGAAPADQLEYAAQLLRQKSNGSAQTYANGLAQASREFAGQKSVTPDNAITLIQSLLGGGQAATAQSQEGVGNLLGSLLGGGGAAGQPAQGGAGNLLGSLLGGAAGAQPQQGQGGGLDIGSLLNAGMSLMGSSSQGGSPLAGLVGALVSGSAMGDSNHHTQSSTLVVNSLLQALGGMMNK